MCAEVQITGRNWCAIAGTPAWTAVPHQIHTELALELHCKQAVELCCLPSGARAAAACSVRMYMAQQKLFLMILRDCGNCMVIFIFLSQI